MITVARDSPEMLTPVVGTWWSPFTARAGVEVTHVDLSPHPVRMRPRRTPRWTGRKDPLGRSTCRTRVAASPSAAPCSAPSSAAGWAALTSSLSFGVSGYGKPFAVARGERADVSFNVSHAGDHGLIAVAASGRLGVDIEERVPKRNLDALIEAVMSPEEQVELAALRGGEKLRLFYRIWTFKEALIKALGTGFSTDVSKFQAPAAMRRGAAAGSFRFPHLPSVAWGLEEIGGERFAAALAYELPSGPCAEEDRESLKIGR